MLQSTQWHNEFSIAFGLWYFGRTYKTTSYLKHKLLDLFHLSCEHVHLCQLQLRQSNFGKKITFSFLMVYVEQCIGAHTTDFLGLYRFYCLRCILLLVIC